MTVLPKSIKIKEYVQQFDNLSKKWKVKIVDYKTTELLFEGSITKIDSKFQNCRIVSMSNFGGITKIYVEYSKKLPEYIMKRLREMSDIDENDNSKDEQILTNNSKKELFDMFLHYEGIIGYTDTILYTIQQIFDMEIDE